MLTNCVVLETFNTKKVLGECKLQIVDSLINDFENNNNNALRRIYVSDGSYFGLIKLKRSAATAKSMVDLKDIKMGDIIHLTNFTIVQMGDGSQFFKCDSFQVTRPPPDDAVMIINNIDNGLKNVNPNDVVDNDVIKSSFEQIKIIKKQQKDKEKKQIEGVQVEGERDPESKESKELIELQFKEFLKKKQQDKEKQEKQEKQEKKDKNISGFITFDGVIHSVGNSTNVRRVKADVTVRIQITMNDKTVKPWTDKNTGEEKKRFSFDLMDEKGITMSCAIFNNNAMCDKLCALFNNPRNKNKWYLLSNGFSIQASKNNSFKRHDYTVNLSNKTTIVLEPVRVKQETYDLIALNPISLKDLTTASSLPQKFNILVAIAEVEEGTTTSNGMSRCTLKVYDASGYRIDLKYLRGYPNENENDENGCDDGQLNLNTMVAKECRLYESSKNETTKNLLKSIDPTSFPKFAIIKNCEKNIWLDKCDLQMTYWNNPEFIFVHPLVHALKMEIMEKQIDYNDCHLVQFDAKEIENKKYETMNVITNDQLLENEIKNLYDNVNSGDLSDGIKQNANNTALYNNDWIAGQLNVDANKIDTNIFFRVCENSDCKGNRIKNGENVCPGCNKVQSGDNDNLDFNLIVGIIGMGDGGLKFSINAKIILKMYQLHKPQDDGGDLEDLNIANNNKPLNARYLFENVHMFKSLMHSYNYVPFNWKISSSVNRYNYENENNLNKPIELRKKESIQRRVVDCANQK